MADYQFVTIWRVEAAIEDVWDAIYDSLKWPQWWQSVAKVTEIEAGDENGLGSVRRYEWTTRLPYTLAFDMRVTRIERPNILEGEAFGELTGTGLWEFTADDGHTMVKYTWRVRTTKTWMNILAPIARPVFAWNHNAVMQDGAVGLAKILDADVEVIEA
ncbi:MAG: polyketide cyclase [Chloroflexi bacterium]|nr:MAG: polyketide cyclase [Chloroflexota bacterium]